MIISVKKQHIPQIAELERKCFSNPWSEKSFLFEAESPDAFFRASFEDERLLGFCILHRAFDEAEVFNVAVDESARRRGIGTALIKDALSFAETRGIKRIFLEVRKSNEAARQLYVKNGFEVCGLRKNYYDDPTEDAILMCIELPGKRGEKE